MAVFTPFLISKTLTADLLVTVAAGTETVLTDIFLAAGTALQAVEAKTLFTIVTGNSTFVAETRTASGTGIAFIPVHQGATVIASDSVPLLQFHIRTAGVVGTQDVGHQAEEIKQPPLFQRRLDWLCSLSFTK